MWLLSTRRAELYEFSSPEAVPGGYAILSHTWDKEEQSFEAVRAIQDQCKSTRKNPRNLVSDKIRQCCIFAEAHGYTWAWIDTCCIDKSNSAELSEAINSMFRWYASAEVCFAYLADVPRDCKLRAPESPFRHAKWHTRGWTLQELLAPLTVYFLSKDWRVIATKLEHADLITAITGIPEKALTRQRHITSFSAAERMSWASRRNTTRIEDRAYCLMGIFDVNLPTIYGEGDRAFQRLQHEIMKNSFDTSLFAWGEHIHHRAELEPEDTGDAFSNWTKSPVYLLASSPKDFARSDRRNVVFTPNIKNPLEPYLPWQWLEDDAVHPDTIERWSCGPFDQLRLPRFTTTSYGVKCHFPIFKFRAVTVAVLLCERLPHNLGLLLHPSPDNIQDPERPRYRVGYSFRKPDGTHRFARLVELGRDLYDLNFLGESVQAKWETFYIVDCSPSHMKAKLEPLRMCDSLHSIVPAPPFRVPNWLVSRLAILGLELSSRKVLIDVPSRRKPLLATLDFADTDLLAKNGFRVVLGTCHARKAWVVGGEQSLAPQDSPAPWALAEAYDDAHYHNPSSAHNCATHHIHAWKDWARDFVIDEHRMVRLWFIGARLPGMVGPNISTLNMHIDLRGKAFDDLLKKKGMPSLDTSLRQTSMVSEGSSGESPVEVERLLGGSMSRSTSERSSQGATSHG